MQTNKMYPSVSYCIINEKCPKSRNGTEPVVKPVNVASIVFDEKRNDSPLIAKKGKEYNSVDKNIQTESTHFSYENAILPKSQQCSWLAKLSALLGGVISVGAIQYYFRFGQRQINEAEWISALPLVEQKEARELMSTIKGNDSFVLHEPSRNMNKTEALLRLFATLRLPTQLSLSNDTYPACAKTPMQLTYWEELIVKKYDFDEIRHFNKSAMPQSNFTTLAPLPSEQLSSEPTPPPPSRVKDPSERNAWLHTLGISREIPKLDHNYTIRFVDEIIQEKIVKTFAIRPTVAELSHILPVKVEYALKTVNGSESTLQDNYIDISLREILIEESRNRFNNAVHSDGNEAIIKKITFMLKQKSNRISYLEFIANNQCISLDEELENMLEFFSISPDIDDAYTTMAKNRLAIALFPLIKNEKDDAISQILKRWLDGNLKEKLVGLPDSDNEIMIPDVIALVDSTGGILVSLTTSTFYLWTPDDASEELRAFLTSHLSLGQRNKLPDTLLTTTVEQKICIINPGISFKAPDNIWQYLKELNIGRQWAQLKHYRLAGQPSVQEKSHEHAQKLLADAVVVVALLSFFGSGGSAAACSAIMLANVISGAASTGMYIDTALHASGTKSREKAWETALFSAIITTLGGASDMYNVAKTLGYTEFKGLFKSAGILKTILTVGKEGKAAAAIAEKYIKGDVRQRVILIVESLLRSKQDYPEFLGKNNIEAMLKVLQVAGWLKKDLYDVLTSSVNLDDLFKTKKMIMSRDELSLLPGGTKIAVLDSKTEQLKTLLLGLGEGRFAGYDLHELIGTVGLRHKWQMMFVNEFVFTDGKLALCDGESGMVLAEEDSALDNPHSDREMTASLEVAETQFVRYCNRMKYDRLFNRLLAETASFAKEYGFQKITYRVLSIWSEKFDNLEQRHFLVVANKWGISYVFEPAPENIRYLNLPGLKAQRIMPEEAWKEGFKESQGNSLITYFDFDQEEAAVNYHRTRDLQNTDEKTLTVPNDMQLWQGSAALSTITYSEFLLGYKESVKQILIIKNVRDAIFNDHNSISNYEFILNIFYKSGFIDTNEKKMMLMNFNRDPLSPTLDLFVNGNLINSFNDVLRVSSGKIIRFECQENLSISHTIISLGNGRFAGMDNGIMNSELSNIKRTVIIEQLGVFQDEIFHSFVSGLTYKIFAFDPVDLASEQRKTFDIIEEVSNHSEEQLNGIHFIMNILVKTNKIAPQQAYALERLMHLIFGNLEGDSVSLAKLSKCLIDTKIIETTADLASVEAGRIVLFYSADKNYHILLSLGETKFAGLDNHLLNKDIPSDQLIITLAQIGEIREGRIVNNESFSSIIAGETNLEGTRVSALLGPDGRLTYIERAPRRFSLEIKAHGAAASVNHYDAIELSDIIHGINLQTHPGETIEHIDLISCYGAFGGQRSSAQIIADRLGATVESYKGIVMDSKPLRRGKGVAFKPQENSGSRRILENERWHRRIHDFTERFLNIWHRSFLRPRRQALHEEQPLKLIITDIMSFMKKRLTASSFSLRYPELISINALKSASTILEKSTTSENIITALLTLIYDNDIVTAMIDSFLLIDEHNSSNQVVVHNSLEMCKSYLWEGQGWSFDKYKKLIPVISYRSIKEGQNIYISYDGGVKNLFSETILRIGENCNGQEQWPQALANFINGYNNYLPVLVGVRHEDMLITEKTTMSNFFYLNPIFKSDFSLQIVIGGKIAVRESNNAKNYVLHDAKRTQSYYIDAYDRLDFSSFVLQHDTLSLNLTQLFSNLEPDESSTTSPLRARKGRIRYLPRLIISIVEQGERIIILQRNFPKSIQYDNSELAFYIANEINAYTSLIKVGKKLNNTITAVKSDKENYIYIDPESVETSWISLNIATV